MLPVKKVEQESPATPEKQNRSVNNFINGIPEEDEDEDEEEKEEEEDDSIAKKGNIIKSISRTRSVPKVLELVSKNTYTHRKIYFIKKKAFEIVPLLAPYTI